MEACSLLISFRKGKQGSSEQPLVGEEHCVTTLITAAKETSGLRKTKISRLGWACSSDEPGPFIT